MRKLLSFYLLCTLFAMQVQAQFSGGAGTQDNPYQIRTAQDLDNLRNYIGETHAGKYFKIMNDIDLKDFIGTVEQNPQGWRPIGIFDDNAFNGKLDGSGYTISGLRINGIRDYIGLFSYLIDATVENLNVTTHEAGILGMGGTPDEWHIARR